MIYHDDHGLTITYIPCMHCLLSNVEREREELREREIGQRKGKKRDKGGRKGGKVLRKRGRMENKIKQ